jgi:hypothetical protein
MDTRHNASKPTTQTHPLLRSELTVVRENLQKVTGWISYTPWDKSRRLWLVVHEKWECEWGIGELGWVHTKNRDWDSVRQKGVSPSLRVQVQLNQKASYGNQTEPSEEYTMPPNWARRKEQVLIRNGVSGQSRGNESVLSKQEYKVNSQCDTR